VKNTMNKQLLFIHGAVAFSKYNAFLDHLMTESIDDPLGLELRKRWKDTLKEELSRDGYEVYMPSMPNRQNAKYVEWKIWFERYFEFLRDGIVLVGHSQGGYFLAKYLLENTMPVSIRALYLLAAPFEPDDFGGEDDGDFSFNTGDLVHLSSQVPDIYIFHSKDDTVVPYSHALRYHSALPAAHAVSFEDRGHFNTEEFPELLESIRGL
jgi:hypothetical protein